MEIISQLKYFIISRKCSLLYGDKSQETEKLDVLFILALIVKKEILSGENRAINENKNLMRSYSY